MACKKAFEEYTINGVKVKFPYRPYPSQFTMMDKIIKCIERGQNSLLESPTGSGKSLALLCSSIAWLMVEKEKILQQQLELERTLIDQVTDDIKPENCIKEEQKPDVKVKIEQLNESKTDVKPHIKTESNPDGNIKIEKQDSDETFDQKKMIKTEPNAASIDGVQVKTDQSSDEKPVFKNEASTADVSGENQQENDKKCVLGQTAGTKNDDCTTMEDEELSDDDADFQAPKKRFRTPGGQMPKAKKRRQSGGGLNQDVLDPSAHREWSMELNRPGDELTDNVQTPSNSCHKETENLADDKNWLEDELELPPSPKIYFGTRTHKQISQIVRELNKTEYKTTKMCILASREHTCIHPQVSKVKNKTEECRKSVENKEGKSCSFHARARFVRNQEDLEDYGITKAWEISELVEIGEKIQGCPYYMTREIMKDADIVFCPYNYLIDPLIRKQMDIRLENQIVILDEAHNIEDSSRGAASWSVTPNSLDEAMKDLDYLVSKNMRREQHQVLHEVAANLRRWILAKAEYHSGCHDFSKSSKIWEGQDLKQALNNLGFGPGAVRQLTSHFNKAMKPLENAASRDKKERTHMHAATATLFEGLLMVLSFIIKNGYKYLPDYRVAITKDYALVPLVMPNGFRRKGEFERKLVYTLNFWCLSPAVAFSEIGEYSRSVILTSGTLSPMSTFSSELGCKFPIQLEANHVVGSSQVWVSSLAVGPSGSTLNATYRHTETFDFQDEVGEAIHKVCETVPHGVLCFLPSYSMLDKLIKRWKMTGLWGRLNRLKNTFSEPRRGDKADFDLLMSDFYDCIKLSEDSDDECGEPGALFLAVCRGKVSEGLDFADNNARAVITVGIPFPNVKDIQVELKRKYNNQYCSSRGLLNGSEWYEIQAYRALNQALGRCIRHRNDWGAILLIDERFGKSPKYKNGLSKWIRGRVVHHNNFPNLLSSLEKFTKARLENPCPNNTMVQMPCSSTPKRSNGLNETKCNEESPVSVKSCSQSSETPSEKEIMDICGIKQEEELISTPTPTCPQTTPRLSPVLASTISRLQQCQYTPANQKIENAHVDSFQTASHISEQNHVTTTRTPTTPQLVIPTNQVLSSTPIIGRDVVPKMLALTPRPQFAGTLGNPQRLANPRQVVNIQQTGHLLMLNNVQQTNRPQTICNPQQQTVSGVNRPVLLRFVTASGQPVRHALLAGNRIQFVAPQTSGNNGVILNMVGGHQATLGAGLVQLSGGNQGIRLNIPGQPGEQAMTAQHAVGIVPEAKGGLRGPTSTSGVNGGQGGTVLRSAGVVQAKQEPQSPPETQRENGGLNSTSEARQDLLGKQRDTLGEHNTLDSTAGVKQGSNRTKRLPRKPLFSAELSETLVPGNEDKTGGQSDKAGQSDSSTLSQTRRNIPEPLNITRCGASEPEDEDLDDPDSPLLFCTPPTSFENSDGETEDGIEGDERVNRVKEGNMCTVNDKVVAGRGVDTTKSKPMDTKVDGEMVGITKNNHGSVGMDEKDRKDILDILDDTPRDDSMVTWDVKCKACDSTLCRSVDKTSDESKPRNEEIFIDTMLGNILNSLFSTTKKRKTKSWETLHVPNVTLLHGCCPSGEGKQNKQDMKLNSIYCEEQSQCYVSLVCKNCKEARTTRSRESIIAVRALPCGTKENQKSMVWFNHDKVQLSSPG